MEKKKNNNKEEVKKQNVNSKNESKRKVEKAIEKKEKSLETPKETEVKAKKIKIVVKEKVTTSTNNQQLYRIIGVIVGVLALCGLVFFASTRRDSKEQITYVQDITAEEYFKLKEKDEKSIVLLASPGCGWCQKYRPIINKISADYELPIYYLNTSSLGEKYYMVIEDSEYLTLQNAQSPEPAIPTPTTLLVQKGKELDVIGGYVEYDDVKQFLIINGMIE